MTRLRAAFAGLLRGPALALAARELLAATLDRDACEAAHTNAATTGARQRTQAALLVARGRYTRAVAGMAGVVGDDAGRATPDGHGARGVGDG